MANFMVSVLLALLWVFSLGSILLTLYRWFFDRENRISRNLMGKLNLAIPILGILNFIGFGTWIYSIWMQYTSLVAVESYVTIAFATAVWGIVYLFSHLIIPQLFWIPAMRKVPALSLSFLIPIALTPVVGAWLLNRLFDWYPEISFGYTLGFSFKQILIGVAIFFALFMILFKDEQRAASHRPKVDEDEEVEEEEVEFESGYVHEDENEVEIEIEKPKKSKKKKEED
ncbi:MAG: hypothetical protein H6581_28440 [Bacteroidia bacterium]|nr:hypothetical protein [Bacteroidia bacterium]